MKIIPNPNNKKQKDNRIRFFILLEEAFHAVPAPFVEN